MALVGALLVGVGAAAPAAASTQSVVIASGLSAPTGLAVGVDGSVFVTQYFPGAVLEVSTGNAQTALKSRMPVTGIDVAEDGTVTFTTSVGTSALHRLVPGGRPEQLADLGRFESRENPDRASSYGLRDLDPECAADVPASTTLPGGGEPYEGGVHSRPSAVATLPDGSWVVADERGNSLLRVEDDGRLSTIAVLPPVRTTVTPAVAAARGLPGCTIGADLDLEPAPTDVEVGPDGNLYVSSAPDGAGLSSPIGAVFRVDPDTGDVEKIAAGLRGPSDLAVDPEGTVYVAELFGDQISIADGDTPITFRLATRPSALEYADGALHAAVGFSFGPPTGQVLAIFLR